MESIRHARHATELETHAGAGTEGAEDVLGGAAQADRDQVVRRRRWAPVPSFGLTWQTLLNSVTFGHNVALGTLRDQPAVLAARPWQRRIDALASIVLALPALLVAIPVELFGAALGRGSVVDLRFELL